LYLQHLTEPRPQGAVGLLETLPFVELL